MKRSLFSGVNSTYYRKLNGTGTTNPNSAGFELSSLIAAPNNNSNFMQHHQSGSYAQYSPRPSSDPSVEPYHIPEIQSAQVHFFLFLGGFLLLYSWKCALELSLFLKTQNLLRRSLPKRGRGTLLWPE